MMRLTLVIVTLATGLTCLIPQVAMAQGVDPALPTFRAEARLIQVYASIFDKRGNPLPNLTRGRFQVLDAGQAQPLAVFEGAEEVLSCALLLDTTGSMTDYLPTLKTAVVHFVDELRAEESIALYTFNRTLQVAQKFTTDKKQLKQAVMRTSAAGMTRLFDAVSQVSRDLETRQGKKALVVFTDGDDNASILNAAGASRQARHYGVPIYVIAVGSALKDGKLMKILEELAADTGGVAFRLTKPDKIGEVFSEISRNLQHTYLLSWKLPEGAGTSWRPIKITVDGAEDARIRARQGYWPD
ncbi:MAG TPA: VWA domain-containing protein [Candidatus Acidoferrales bacterium]|jgi:VWFA-related protein|nr:VWA domain-containing protein [Candidatus Acidoferrales bacterium]